MKPKCKTNWLPLALSWESISCSHSAGSHTRSWPQKYWVEIWSERWLSDCFRLKLGLRRYPRNSKLELFLGPFRKPFGAADANRFDFHHENSFLCGVCRCHQFAITWRQSAEAKRTSEYNGLFWKETDWRQNRVNRDGDKEVHEAASMSMSRLIVDPGGPISAWIVL